jgi:hypothetical protein
MARDVAEAQVDLRRVRALRHELISRALNDPDYDSRINWGKKLSRWSCEGAAGARMFQMRR